MRDGGFGQKHEIIQDHLEHLAMLLIVSPMTYPIIPLQGDKFQVSLWQTWSKKERLEKEVKRYATYGGNRNMLDQKVTRLFAAAGIQDQGEATCTIAKREPAGQKSRQSDDTLARAKQAPPPPSKSKSNLSAHVVGYRVRSLE